MTTLAYCNYDGETGWVRYCPACWITPDGYAPPCHAEVTGLNGDTIPCDGCGKEIR